MLKKITYLGAILGASLFAGQGMAIPCFVTMVKGSCWEKYTVDVDVIDAESDQVLMTISIPKGTSWIRQSFEAQTKQRFMLRATFTPVFWKTGEGKQYFAKRYWSLPESINGEVAWNVGACFPGDFSGVPTPPEAGSDCSCDRREIPPVDQP